MPEYKLCYFPVRGKGELPRYILHQAGVPFEDCQMNKDEFATMKPNTPFGQLPVLFVDGKPLAQSLAIARYLATAHGLNGDNDLDRALCDMYVDGISSDLYTSLRSVIIPLMSGNKAEHVRASTILVIVILPERHVRGRDQQ